MDIQAMEKRRLLYCELTYSNYTQARMEERIMEAVKSMDAAGALEHFREQPEKPYFMWLGEQYWCKASFKLRPKTPWDIESVFYHLNELDGAFVTGLSWFPSREPYGGTVQEDGSVIETWDI